MGVNRKLVTDFKHTRFTSTPLSLLVVFLSACQVSTDHFLQVQRRFTCCMLENILTALAKFIIQTMIHWVRSWMACKKTKNILKPMRKGWGGFFTLMNTSMHKMWVWSFRPSLQVIYRLYIYESDFLCFIFIYQNIQYPCTCYVLIKVSIINKNSLLWNYYNYACTIKVQVITIG